MYIVLTFVCIYIYIFIYTYTYLSLSLYIYIYIHTYIPRGHETTTPCACPYGPSCTRPR